MRRIYFLRRADGTGPIKIGCSERPAERRRQLNSDLRADFAILATAPGDHLTERNLHLKFATLRADAPLCPAQRTSPVPGVSEWFEPAPELLAYIEAARSTDEIHLTDEECRERVWAERYLAGETLQAIANDFGITRERVRQVLRRIGVESLGHREEHKPRHIETPSEAAAVQAYVAGEQPKAIQERFGLTYPQLRLAVKRAGVPRSAPGRWRSADADKLAEQTAFLYRRGIKPAEIADRLGLSHVTSVYRYLKRAHVAPRTNKGRPRKAAA